MNIIFFILSAIILGYWLRCLKEPYFGKPTIIQKFGYGVFIIGIIFLLLGIYL